MLYAFGFVNRRSGVQIPKVAQHLGRPSWPTVAYTSGHAQLRGTWRAIRRLLGLDEARGSSRVSAKHTSPWTYPVGIPRVTSGGAS